MQVLLYRNYDIMVHIMKTFADRLREEMEFMGLSRKELAYRADVKRRALDMYLGTQCSMPPADAAVRMAKAVNVTVEYLITGETPSPKAKRNRLLALEHDLESLPQPVIDSVSTMIHTLAENEKKFTPTKSKLSE